MWKKRCIFGYRIKDKMNTELKEFITKELKYTSHPKYYKYIEEYISNLTNYQLLYWEAWMNGKMSIY